MKSKHALLFLTFISLTIFSCKKDLKREPNSLIKKQESAIKYAKGFDIQHFKNYKKLIIKAPYQNAKETFEYILINPKSDQNLKTLQIPIKSFVTTSTTHIPMIELLNIENRLVGFPNSDFVSSQKTRLLIENGAIEELGSENNINTEVLLNLQPELVIGHSVNSNNKTFSAIEKMGIPVILNGDWLEETPLGRAEWIKFFGVLFNKEKQADSIFKAIEKNYIEAKEIAKKSKLKPTVISGGLYKDVWYLPAGESFEATFLRDANTHYLWGNSKGKGSLSLNIENVFLKGKNAQVWVSPSFHTSLKSIQEANAIYSQFKAFQTKSVYSYMNTKGEKNGILYFELSPTRPDLVLKDIIKIAHPELLPEYDLTFFKKLN